MQQSRKPTTQTDREFRKHTTISPQKARKENSKEKRRTENTAKMIPLKEKTKDVV
jgi:hypothetical protein